MSGKEDILKYTIPQLLRWRVHQTGDKVALREKDFGYWNNYTWNDFYDRVRKVALGLEKLGLKKDDKLALIGDNIPEMLFMAVGAVTRGGLAVHPPYCVGADKHPWLTPPVLQPGPTIRSRPPSRRRIRPC